MTREILTPIERKYGTIIHGVAFWAWYNSPLNAPKESIERIGALAISVQTDADRNDFLDGMTLLFEDKGAYYGEAASRYNPNGGGESQ